MTRKSIERQLDGIIEKVCKARNLNPAPSVKGGEAEIANASVYSAIKTLEPQILALAGVPLVQETAPEVTDEASEDTDAASAA